MARIQPEIPSISLEELNKIQYPEDISQIVKKAQDITINLFLNQAAMVLHGQTDRLSGTITALDSKDEVAKLKVLSDLMRDWNGLDLHTNINAAISLLESKGFQISVPDVEIPSVVFDE